MRPLRNDVPAEDCAPALLLARVWHARHGRTTDSGARRVERPPYEQLVAEVARRVAVGRKYGVSDNAVRKWVRA